MSIQSRAVMNIPVGSAGAHGAGIETGAGTGVGEYGGDAAEYRCGLGPVGGFHCIVGAGGCCQFGLEVGGCDGVMGGSCHAGTARGAEGGAEVSGVNTRST